MMSAVLLANLISYRFHLRRSGRVWVGRCPSGKHEDKHPSFYVFADREDGHGRFKCHSCGWSGNEITWCRFAGEDVRGRPDPRIELERRRKRSAEAQWQRLLYRCPDLPEEARIFLETT